MVRELVTATGDAQPGMRGLQRGGQLPGREAGRGRRAGHGQDGADVPGDERAVHAVPQSSVQRVPAEPVLGAERLLPPGAGRGRADGRRPDDARRRRSSTSTSPARGRCWAATARREIFLEMRDGKLVDRDAAELDAAPIFYELRNGQVAVAYPAFVDGTSLAELFAEQGPEFGNSGRLAQVDRRQELAKLIAGVAAAGAGGGQPDVGALLRLRVHERRSTTWGRTIRRRIRSCSRSWPAQFRAQRVRHEAADAVDRAERGVRAEQPGGRRQRGGRSGAGQAAAVQPVLRAADAGRSSCTSRCWRRREADAGLKGFDREAMKLAVAARSSTRPWGTTRGPSRRRSTGRSRRR